MQPATMMACVGVGVATPVTEDVGVGGGVDVVGASTMPTQT